MNDQSPVRPLVARVQRVLPATPDVVYAEWLDSEALSAWMCPRPARCLNVELEPRPGGRLRFDIEDRGEEFFVVGTFTVLERPHRLSFTWHCSTWGDPDLESVVTIELEEIGEAETLLTLEHALLPFDLIERHEHGWVAIAAQLDEVLRRRLTAPPHG
jgi:uncharacterized protein YndB with AHSA1/START domain